MAIRNRINRRIGGRLERFDPNAIDADGDGRVQDATAFERPDVLKNRLPQQTTAQNLSGSMGGGQGGMWSIQELQELAIEQGWTVRRSKKNHPQFISPDGAVFSTSSTPSDGRSYLNFISDLRRNGLIIPRKGDKKKQPSGTFSLEQAKPTLRPEDKANALRLVAAKQKPGTRLTLDQLAETLDIDDDDLKNELRDAVNEKFKDYFPSAAPEETKPEERNLTNREKRRRGLKGDIGPGDSVGKTKRDKHVDIVGKNLVEEAEAAGVSLDAILDDSDMDNDVSWSSNSWSFAKKQKQQAADAVIVRTNENGEKEVLMIRRKTAPFTDGFALPGGLLDEGETLEQTADREMEEEVGISASKAESKRYIGEIEARDWDPRFVEGVRVGGARYDVPADTEVVAASDAKAAEWIPIKDLAAGKHRIGFGHAGWLSLAFEDDSEVSRKLDILARASRHRNQRIIREVNKKRKEAGEKLFTRLGSPNKQYIPEGSGPLGMRKVDNVAADMAKTVTRNPGFFDKKTEEMFIYRATHSSADTAKKFNMTEREVDDKLREATQKLEDKIRKDIKQSLDKKRNTKLSGSISRQIRDFESAQRAVEKLKLTDAQKNDIEFKVRDIAQAFKDGSIYGEPIYKELEDRKKALLDSIRIEIASDGVSMLIAEPHPLITPYHAINRDWESVRLPDDKAIITLFRELNLDEPKAYENENEYEGVEKFTSYLYKILEDINSKNTSSARGDIETDQLWVGTYILSLRDVQAAAYVLGYSDGLHDVFGHFGTGRGFDRHGEWANYLAFKDLINQNKIGLSEEELNGLNKFWFREYGIQHLFRSESLQDIIGGNVDKARDLVYDYNGPIKDLLEIIDSGENGLGGVSGSKISGSISSKKKQPSSGKKIKDVSIGEFIKASIADTENKLKTRATSFYPRPSLYGSMGLMDDDAEVGEYVDYLKDKMGPTAWAGEQGQEVRDIATRMFNLDISKEERDRLIDDLLDIEVQYTDYEPEDTFDYAAEEAAAQGNEWDTYLDSLSPEEYDFWKDYNPSGYDGDGVSSSSTDVPLPWEREVPLPSRGNSKKKKRKFFGWRKRQEKPSRYINSTKFYGHEHMQEKQAEQLEMFRNWKNKKDWKGLHNAHYDWWAFPIDRGSAAYGDGYNVAGENIEKLKKNPKYVSNLKELATIYAEAMGWDLEKGEWFEKLDWNKGQDPYTQAYGARLYKIARSLQIFEMTQEFDSFLTMVQSLRSDDQLKRRIGKSQYWDNPAVPFNNLTPGTRRATRKMREEMQDKKPYGKLYGGMAGRNIKKIPTSNQPARRSIVSPYDKRMRFMREIDVDNWYIFVDDINEYAAKAKSRDIEISTPQYQELMKAIAIINSLEAVPTDDNGISIDMSDEEVKRLRVILKTMTSLPNFFNINEIYEALPTRQKPRTIEVEGPDV